MAAKARWLSLLAVPGTVLLALPLFLASGAWHRPWYWIYTGITALILTIGAWHLDRGLIKERVRPGPGGQDALVVYILKALTVLHLVIAGLYPTPPSVPPWLQFLALLVYGVSLAVTLWTMAANPFFSSVVRLQTDRGHTLIRSGPYRLIRHPGYAAINLMMLSSGIALGSWWSVLPMLVFCLLVLRRMAIEERFLREQLPGYVDYVRDVPHKLIPGIW